MQDSDFATMYKYGILLVYKSQFETTDVAKNALYSSAASKYQIAISGNAKYRQKIVDSVELESINMWDFFLIASQSPYLFEALCDKAKRIRRIDLTARN